jgi:hypothetical protein
MRVGSLVVCIDDGFNLSQLNTLEQTPKKGKYYIVRGIINYNLDIPTEGLLLEEVINPLIMYVSGVKFEPSFASYRFWDLEIPESHDQNIYNLLHPDIPPGWWDHSDWDNENEWWNDQP